MALCLNFFLNHLPHEITVQRLFFYVFKIFALMHCSILKVLLKFAPAKIREKKKSRKPEKMKSWGSRYWRRRGGRQGGVKGERGGERLGK